MQIYYDTQTAELHVRLDGEIDHHSSIPMRAEIDAAIYAHLPHTVILDFSEVSFMDSSGIGLIMGRYRAVGLIGGELKVTNVPENLSRIIELSGVTSLGVI